MLKHSCHSYNHRKNTIRHYKHFNYLFQESEKQLNKNKVNNVQYNVVNDLEFVIFLLFSYIHSDLR